MAQHELARWKTRSAFCTGPVFFGLRLRLPSFSIASLLGTFSLSSTHRSVNEWSLLSCSRCYRQILVVTLPSSPTRSRLRTQPCAWVTQISEQFSQTVRHVAHTLVPNRQTNLALVEETFGFCPVERMVTARYHLPIELLVQRKARRDRFQVCMRSALNRGQSVARASCRCDVNSIGLARVVLEVEQQWWIMLRGTFLARINRVAK